MKVDCVRAKCGRPPPERSEIVPCLLIATFLVDAFAGLIAVGVSASRWLTRQVRREILASRLSGARILFPLRLYGRRLHD